MSNLNGQLLPRETRLGMGHRMKAARLLKGLTLEALATKSGVSKSMVHAIERGKSNISVGKLLKITGVLDTSIGYVITGDVLNVCYPVSVSEIEQRTVGELRSHKETYTRRIADAFEDWYAAREAVDVSHGCPKPTTSWCVTSSYCFLVINVRNIPLYDLAEMGQLVDDLNLPFDYQVRWDSHDDS